MRDSEVIQLKIRFAKEHFLEPALPSDAQGHAQRIGEWRTRNDECTEIVRALAGASFATQFEAVMSGSAIDDPDPIIRAGANLVNVIAGKVVWLSRFEVRLRVREGLRDVRA